MEIIINSNDDTIEVKDCPQPFKIECKYPHQTMSLLEEIFNRLKIEDDRELNEFIILTYINEDRSKTVGEW